MEFFVSKPQALVVVVVVVGEKQTVRSRSLLVLSSLDGARRNLGVAPPPPCWSYFRGCGGGGSGGATDRGGPRGAIMVGGFTLWQPVRSLNAARKEDGLCMSEDAE